MNKLIFKFMFVVAAICSVGTLDVCADDEFGKRASWSVPQIAAVRADINEWLKTREVDEVTRLKVETLWSLEREVMSGDELLEQLGETFALVDPKAGKLVAFCKQGKAPIPLPEFEILADENQPPFVRNNLQLLYARWLAQQRLVDESLEHTRELSPADVVDPASLLFYQSVAYHRLLDKEKCLPALTTLLENEQAIPRRYATVARLMEADLRPLKTDTLDEISRLMNDITRRLELARAGKRVRKQEDDVVAKLDKMIEELEKQMQQQMAAAAGGAPKGGLNPSQPAQDSAPLGGQGPGNVDERKTGSRSGWGNLPQKERQEALQRISKDLPAHYREVIEEYFRKLANDGN